MPIRGQPAEATTPSVPLNIPSKMFEVDWRVVFANRHAGTFFPELIKEHGWDSLLGNDDWFLRTSFVEDFKKHAKINSKGVLMYTVGTSNPIAVTRKRINELLGVRLNSNFDLKEHQAFLKKHISSSLEIIAPYRTLSGKGMHYAEKGGYLKTKGMQCNVMAVAKWFTLNCLGISKKDFIRRETANFVASLMHNDFPESFCMCQVILDTLKKHVTTKYVPIPFITSYFIGKLRGESKTSDDMAFPVANHRVWSLLNWEVSGVWQGKLIPRGPNRPYVLSQVEKKAFMSLHGMLDDKGANGEVADGKVDDANNDDMKVERRDEGNEDAEVTHGVVHREPVVQTPFAQQQAGNKRRQDSVEGVSAKKCRMVHLEANNWENDVCIVNTNLGTAQGRDLKVFTRKTKNLCNTQQYRAQSYTSLSEIPVARKQQEENEAAERAAQKSKKKAAVENTFVDIEDLRCLVRPPTPE